MFPQLRDEVDVAKQAELARQLVMANRNVGLLTAIVESASKDKLLLIWEARGLEAKRSKNKNQLTQLIESSPASTPALRLARLGRRRSQMTPRSVMIPQVIDEWCTLARSHSRTGIAWGALAS